MRKVFLTLLAVSVSLVLTAMSFAADRMETSAALTTESHLISADRLIGLNIENLQGEDLGEITDVILDETTGRVAYLVVAPDEYWRMGNERRIVPFSAMKRHQDRLVVDISTDRLTAAPRWEPGREQLDYERDLHEFFGGSPYWESLSEMREGHQTVPTKRYED